MTIRDRILIEVTREPGLWIEDIVDRLDISIPDAIEEVNAMLAEGLLARCSK